MNNTQAPSASIISVLRRRTDYLSSTEVMKTLGVSRQSLCGWVRAGTIRAFKLGKSYKFDPNALADWIEACAVS